MNKLIDTLPIEKFLLELSSMQLKEQKPENFLPGLAGLLNPIMGLPVVNTVLKAATDAVKAVAGKSYVNSPKVLRFPVKTGGLLRLLIPIFAGLIALGALGGRAAGITKAVNAASAAKQQFDEAKRHNEKIEVVASENGLYLKPYKKR